VQVNGKISSIESPIRSTRGELQLWACSSGSRYQPLETNASYIIELFRRTGLLSMVSVVDDGWQRMTDRKKC
jgi:hypothetical protein